MIIPRPNKEGLLVLKKTSSSCTWEIEDNCFTTSLDEDIIQIDFDGYDELEVSIKNPSKFTLDTMNNDQLYLGISIEDSACARFGQSEPGGYVTKTKFLYHKKWNIYESIKVHNLNKDESMFYIYIDRDYIPRRTRKILKLSDRLRSPYRDSYYVRYKICLIKSHEYGRGKLGKTRVYKTSNAITVNYNR